MPSETVTPPPGVETPSGSDPSGIDPADLAATLRVLARLSEIDDLHPDFIAVRHATAKM